MSSTGHLLPRNKRYPSLIRRQQFLVSRLLPLSMRLGQSEAAQPLPHSDSLSRLQAEAEVFGSFEQQNDGGAEVELPHRRPLLQDHAFSLRGHAPFTIRLQRLAVDVAVVVEGTFAVARSVGLKLLRTNTLEINDFIRSILYKASSHRTIGTSFQKPFRPQRRLTWSK